MGKRIAATRFTSIVSVITLLFGLLSTGLVGTTARAVASEPSAVVLVGSLQSELGATGDWKPDDMTTKMVSDGDGFYHFTGTLPAGSYEYKVALNGNWDVSYGKNGGGDNIPLTLAAETSVTFYYNHNTHQIANSTTYTPLAADKLPRLVGTIQTAIGEQADWSPSTASHILKDSRFNNQYAITVHVPAGTYKYKVALGNNWDVSYGANGGSGDLTLKVLADTDITFTYTNDSTHLVVTDYNPGGSDGAVDGAKLFHNTWEGLYRSPFGAVAAGTPVTLRLQAKQGDLTRARVVLKNYDTGSSKLYNMAFAGSSKVNDQEVEFWEAEITPEVKGVYGYKFVAGDADAQMEYGEDSAQGGIGKAVDASAELFQLTVFDPGFRTPDWMKKAVVYQIFPDRFNNGDPTNDSAKDQLGSRGPQKIEHMKWSDLPDNPNLKNQQGYTQDGEFSNDFFGGDIKGIQDKLDYLQSLGVNTLYLNPIAAAASNHKYDAADWKALDPMFGTPEQFKAFTDELKDRNMHLIMDGVFNHTGDDSIYFDRYGKYKTVGAYEYWSRIFDLINTEQLSEADAKQTVRDQLLAEGQEFSPYGFENWFNIENEKVDVGTANERYKYQSWWGYDSLPEIKSIDGTEVPHASELNNEAFANYIFRDADSAAKSWLTSGASGWRLDVANEVDPAFWVQFRQQVKNTQQQTGVDPLILGEIWDDASKYFLGDQYDSVMNYRFRGAVIGFLKNGNAASADGDFRAIQEDYPKEAFYSLMNLMGSHDTARAVFVLGNGTDSSERAEYDKNYNYELGKQRLKLAAAMQMGYPGAPTLYYGDEAGLTGSKDPDDRRTYPWGKEDQELITWYKQVGKIRQDNQDLFAAGDLKTLYANGDVYVYARKLNDQYAIVAINRGNADQTVELDLTDSLINGIKLTDQLNTAYKVTTGDNKLTLSVPKMGARMLTADAGQSLAAPAAVADISAEEGFQTATLQWSASPAAASYKVYQSTIDGALYQEIKSTTELSAQVTGLKNGQRYYFAVAAVDAAGDVSPKTVTDAAVIPHASWNTGDFWISDATVTGSTYVNLDQAQTVAAEVWIKGATDSFLAEGLQANLQVQAPGSSEWASTPAAYTSQKGGYGTNNGFEASFMPYQAGVYHVRMAFTTDAGRTWKYTPESSKVIEKDALDSIPPVQSLVLKEPKQESGQVNLSWTVTGVVYDDTATAEEQYYDAPKLYQIVRDGVPVANVAGDVLSFKDYNVENGQTYQYKVVAYDKLGNHADSNAVAVKPDLVTVEVTFKVHAPDYTPKDMQLNIPGSLNGWNTGAWGMSRNGATTTDWEFTTYIQDGTNLTYKYVKANSWDQEGLADHTRNDPALDQDVSYYGYGAQGTDLNVIITNQGDNKMVIQDRILRWIDQPLVVLDPVDNAKVNTDTITVSGSAIREGALTINGEPVEVNADMTFSKAVKLAHGDNTITVHVEPSATNKSGMFKGDGDAIRKATRTVTLHVNTTAGTAPSNPTTGGTTAPAATPAPTQAPETQKVDLGSLKPEAGSEKVSVQVGKDTKEVLLPATAAELLNNKKLEIVNESIAVAIPAEVLTKLKELVPADQMENAQISLQVQPVAKEEAAKLIQSASPSYDVQPAGDVYDFKLSVKTQDGKLQTLTQFEKPLTLTFKVNTNAYKKLANVYYIADDGKLEYIPGKWVDGSLVADIYHFSKYAVLTIDKTYADVDASFWAADVIKTLSAKQIVNGVTDTTFEPNRNVTRAEFAAMLVRALGLKAAAASAFEDVDANAWYAQAVAAAQQAGLVNGKSDTSFAPQDMITREEMASMIVRASELASGKKPTKAAAAFADQSSISVWAMDAVSQAYGLGFIQGREENRFAPQASATRAECAQVLSLLLDSMNQ